MGEGVISIYIAAPFSSFWTFSHAFTSSITEELRDGNTQFGNVSDQRVSRVELILHGLGDADHEPRATLMVNP